jgi:dolichol-phosphate mannosyltransferase
VLDEAAASEDAMTEALVVVPTYEEAANIERLLRAIRSTTPDVDVLVIDDNSPDGTADIADVMAQELGQIEVLRRERKAGLGSAYRAGFALGVTRGYPIIIEMDADFSHDPAALSSLLREIRLGADLVIGSRYIPGGSIPEWSGRRRALSRYGNKYAAWILGANASDLTSGYRAYRSEALHRAGYSETTANGYAFQIELAYRVGCAGGRITEVPIVFNDRTQGRSKMSTRITLEALARVTWWGVRDRSTRRVVRHAPGTASEGVLV